MVLSLDSLLLSSTVYSRQGHKPLVLIFFACLALFCAVLCCAMLCCAVLC